VTYAYASGLVNSRKSFTFAYGRLEARVWLPGNLSSAHNWPAFWANGTGQHPITGELDVMEILSGGQPCWHFHSLETDAGDCADQAKPSGWHTYTAEWRPGRVDIWYDGSYQGALTEGITSSPMYLILNLGMSTRHGGPLRAPSEMLVDYVKVTRQI
jgi:beta-glucanase (GH16 family)